MSIKNKHPGFKEIFRIISNDIANNNHVGQFFLIEAKEEKPDRSILLVKERQTLSSVTFQIKLVKLEKSILCRNFQTNQGNGPDDLVFSPF